MWNPFNKKNKFGNKKEKTQSVNDLEKEVQNKLAKITDDNLMQATIEHAKRLGHIFKDDTAAKKWAMRKLEKEFTNQRIQIGLSGDIGPFHKIQYLGQLLKQTGTDI